MDFWTKRLFELFRRKPKMPIAPEDHQHVVNEMLRSVLAGIKPPVDREAEGWTWDSWQREAAAHQMDGWTFCRFANRTSIESVGFVFGLVRGYFGLWQQPFPVCNVPLGEHADQILTCITHLPSGLGLGVFEDRETAAHACLIAMDVGSEWHKLDPMDRTTWDFSTDTMREAWAFNGIVPSASKHAHNGSQSLLIWERNAAALDAGKPERLS